MSKAEALRARFEALPQWGTMARELAEAAIAEVEAAEGRVAALEGACETKDGAIVRACEALRLAVAAFEGNWAINWDDLEAAARDAEAALAGGEGACILGTVFADILERAQRKKGGHDGRDD